MELPDLLLQRHAGHGGRARGVAAVALLALGGRGRRQHEVLLWVVLLLQERRLAREALLGRSHLLLHHGDLVHGRSVAELRPVVMAGCGCGCGWRARARAKVSAVGGRERFVSFVAAFAIGISGSSRRRQAGCAWSRVTIPLLVPGGRVPKEQKTPPSSADTLRLTDPGVSLRWAGLRQPPHRKRWEGRRPPDCGLQLRSSTHTWSQQRFFSGG